MLGQLKDIIHIQRAASLLEPLKDMIRMSGVTQSSFQSDGRSAADWGASLFVWGIWAIMLLAALVLVGKYGSNVPFGDEWCACVGQLTGECPANASWLWKQENEHRLPLPKLC